jgi:hypothetical protein
LGATEWAKREMEFDNAEELEEFKARKLSELDGYDAALEKREKDKELVDCRRMTKGEFIAKAIKEHDCPTYTANEDTRNHKWSFQLGLLRA